MLVFSDFIFGLITLGKLRQFSKKLSMNSKVAFSTFHTVENENIQQIK